MAAQRELDERLIDLLLANADQVEDFIARRIPPWHRRAVSVEDVRQEVWRAAFRADPGLRPSSPAEFASWLLALARGRIVDAVKHASRHKRGAGARALQQLRRAASSVMDLFSSVAAVQPTPSGELVRDESAQALREAMERLPPHQRRAIAMFHLEGQSQDEIARLLGMSVPAVKSHLAKGRRRLREMLTCEHGDAVASARKRPHPPAIGRASSEEHSRAPHS